MYRLTVYDNSNTYVADEFEDKDELRDAVDSAMADLENREIKSFVVSRISEKTYQKPFWEDR